MPVMNGWEFLNTMRGRKYRQLSGLIGTFSLRGEDYKNLPLYRSVAGHYMKLLNEDAISIIKTI